MSYGALSTKYGLNMSTIHKRATRDQWDGAEKLAKRAAEKNLAKLEETLTAKALEVAQPLIAAKAQEFVNKSIERASRISDKVSDMVEIAEEPDAILKLANALDRADTIGRRGLGLDRDAQSNSINLHVSLGVGTLSGEGKPGACLSGDYSDAIDVVSTPVSNGVAEGEN